MPPRCDITPAIHKVTSKFTNKNWGTWNNKPAPRRRLLVTANDWSIPIRPLELVTRTLTFLAFGASAGSDTRGSQSPLAVSAGTTATCAFPWQARHSPCNAFQCSQVVDGCCGHVCIERRFPSTRKLHPPHGQHARCPWVTSLTLHMGQNPSTT